MSQIYSYDDFMRDMSDDPITDSELDIFAVDNDMDVMMMVGDIPIMTRSDISVIVGPPKARKTFFASLLVASFFLKNNDCLSAPSSGNVLWIDTEQSDSHAAKVYRRINSMRGLDPNEKQPDFAYHCLRKYDSDERLKITKKLIRHYSPDLVVIDGIADLCRQQNDESSATILQDTMMSLSAEQNCHIVSVIHSNSGSVKPRGHTGSNLTRKCETIFTLLPRGSDTKVSFTCRDRQPDPIAFFIDASAIPVISDEGKSPKINLIKLFTNVISDNEALTNYNLTKNIKEFIYNSLDLQYSDRTYQRYIAKALKEGIIFKGKDNKYRLDSQQLSRKEPQQ